MLFGKRAESPKARRFSTREAFTESGIDAARSLLDSLRLMGGGTTIELHRWLRARERGVGARTVPVSRIFDKLVRLRAAGLLTVRRVGESDDPHEHNRYEVVAASVADRSVDADA
jgi:hypothetical protein